MKTLYGMFVLLVACLSLSGQTITVNYASAIEQPDIYYKTGTNIFGVEAGNQVRIGFFSSYFDQNDLLSINSAWIQYDSTTIRTIFGYPYHFASTAFSSSNLFENQKVWLWLFKTSDNALPTVDFSNVTHYGLFSSDDTDWMFPDGYDPLKNTISPNTSQINQSFFGSYDVNHIYLYSIVPEPSIFGLMFLGIVLIISVKPKKAVSFLQRI